MQPDRRAVDRAPLGRALEFAQRLRRQTVLRYLAASALSLAVDIGSFLLLLELGAAATPASSAAYALGIVSHWMLSSRKVFADSVAARGPQRTRQKAMFVISALIGLALTTAVVGSATLAGIDPRIAKLAAIVASFTATWLLRSRIVFTAAAAG